MPATSTYAGCFVTTHGKEISHAQHVASLSILMQPHYMACSGGLYVAEVRDANHPLSSVAGQWYPVGDSGRLAWVKDQIENNRDELIRLFETKRAARLGR